jgi:hypothetical protein
MMTNTIRRWTRLGALAAIPAFGMGCARSSTTDGLSVVKARGALTDQSAAIQAKYAALGGQPILGTATTAVTQLPGLEAAYQSFTLNGNATGTIVSSDDIGTFMLPPTIAAKYLATQSELDSGNNTVLSDLGRPTGDATIALNCCWMVAFEGGQIYDDGVAHAVYGGIYLRYRDVAATLGVPVSDEGAEPPTGRSQTFQNGKLYWSPSFGAWEIVGPIYAAGVTPASSYRPNRATAANYVLGFPKSPSAAIVDSNNVQLGASQTFENATVYVKASGQLVMVPTDMEKAFEDNGGPTGALGMPKGIYSDVSQNSNYPNNTDSYQNFDKGVLVNHRMPVGAPGFYAFSYFDFWIEDLSSGGCDAFLCGAGNQDPYWYFTVTDNEDTTYYNNLRLGTGSGDDPDWSYPNDAGTGAHPLGSPPKTASADLVFTIEFSGYDVASSTQLLGSGSYNYSIDNLWGYFDQNANHAPAATDHGSISGHFGLRAFGPSLSGDDFMHNNWWSFHNFNTDHLTYGQFADTFTDVSHDEGWLRHPINNSFYLLYKGMAKNGNCFGMAVESIYAEQGHSPYTEPLFSRWFPDTATGCPLYCLDDNCSADVYRRCNAPDTLCGIDNQPCGVNAADGTTPADGHLDLARQINKKHGYQLGASYVGFFLGRLGLGMQHAPYDNLTYGNSLAQAGTPTIVSITSNFFWRDAHTMRVISYDMSSHPCLHISAPYCHRIYVANPNIPAAALSNDGPPVYNPLEEFIEVAPDDAHGIFAYLEHGNPDILYTGRTNTGGRMFIAPFDVVNSAPETFLDAVNLVGKVYAIFTGTGPTGAVNQVSDQNGHTLFNQPIYGTPQWDDMVVDDTARLPNFGPMLLDGPIDGQAYAGVSARGVTHNYLMSQRLDLPDGTPYDATIQTQLLSSSFTIPGTISKSELVSVSDIGLNSRAITLAMPADAPPKAVKWLVTGFDKSRWAEFSNMSMQPAQLIRMHTEKAGYHVVFENNGPRTSAFLRVSKGGDVAVDVGTVDIPSGTSTVDFENTQPWSVDSLNPVAWYRASDFTASGGTVGVWTDHTGHGHDISQPSSWAQPTYNPAGWNGTQPTVTFSGGNLLTRDNWSDAPLGPNADFSILAVMRSAAPQNSAVAAWWDVNGGGFTWADVKATGGQTLLEMTRVNAANDGQTFAGTQDLGTGRHVVAWRYVAADRSLRLSVDGVTVGSSTQGNIAPLGPMTFILGAKSTLATGLFQGDISELMIVGRSLSDGEIVSYTNYARTTWSGLPAAGNTDPCVGANNTFSPSTTRCDDGHTATYGDHCLQGVCIGTALPAGSPAELSPTAWYSATPSEIIITDGGVSNWLDRSAQHRDLSQTFYAGRPLFNATGWNGSDPTVSFNGHALLRSDSWSGSPTGQDGAFTVMAVIKANAGQTAAVASWWNESSYGGASCEVATSGAGTVAQLLRSDDSGQRQSVFGTADLTGRHFVVWRFAPGVMKVTVDGSTTSQPVGSIGTITPDAFILGAQNYLPTGLFSGDISELALIPSSISDDQVANLRLYAQSQWHGLP